MTRMRTMIALRWQGVVDFLVLAVALYFLLRWSREARALRLALGILALRIGALVAGQLDLLITSWVLDAATVVALLALVVVFQPELRRALIRLDVVGRATDHVRTPALTAVSRAAFSLAQERCGALIVVIRKDSLGDLVTPGVPLGGQVSEDILEAIFRKESPVHDGAAIVEGDVIVRVGSVLPLTHRAAVPPSYGTRHRAAMGLAERSDALVIVTSEERGEVALMWEDQAEKVGTADELLDALGRLSGGRARPHATLSRALRPQAFGLKVAALGLAALVWGLTFLLPGRSVRARTVPIEFTDVPAGLSIAAQSTDSLQVWLRGNPLLLDAITSEDLVARCNLASAHEGTNTVPLSADALDLPFGIAVDGLNPQQVRIRLVNPARSQPSG